MLFCGGREIQILPPCTYCQPILLFPTSCARNFGSDDHKINNVAKIPLP